MTWDQERVEVLEKLWAEGLSASQIARRMGGMSRNAVIGKVHRLGIGRADVRVNVRRIARRHGRNAAARQLSVMATAAKKKALRRLGKFDEARATSIVVSPEFKAIPLPPEPPRPSKLVSFAELEPDMCKFVYGDPKTSDHGFCGCKAMPGSPYCAGHHNVCLTGVPAPKQRVRTYIPHKSNGYRILANSVRGFE
jgi:GcrA cell cycle regulator